MLKMQNEIDDLRVKLDTILGILQGGAVATASTSCKHTLYSWLFEWADTYKRPDVKPKTLQCMKININNHIKPHIEDKPLKEVTTLDLKRVLGKVKVYGDEVKYSRTCKDVFDILTGSFRIACRIGIIADNPMEGVKPPKHKRKKGEALTIRQQEQFLKLIENHIYRDLYTFYMLTGCRMSEALTVEWADVDFDKNIIHVKGTKTDSSDRKIPMFPEVRRLLRGCFPSGSHKVFDVHAECVRSSFRRLKDKHKLPYSIKDLRHTFATRCYENGINLKTIQKWLGHSKLDTTANIYTHVTDEYEKGEIKKYNPNIKIT